MLFGGARWVRYQQTKLANLVFTYALQQKLDAKGSKVKAVVAHPVSIAMLSVKSANIVVNLSEQIGSICDESSSYNSVSSTSF